MRLSSKTVEATIADFSDFSGGLNLRTSPENIAQNELSSCKNMTYSSQPGRLRTRDGIGAALATFSDPVSGLCWYKNQLLAAVKGNSTQTLYKITLGTTPSSTSLGTLTSTQPPVFCEFGTDLFIASGGTLQKYDGTTLSTVTDAPSFVFIYARSGRLWGFVANSDVLRGSAVGDPTEWTVPPSGTDADPVETQIGYKVAGSIIAAIPSLTDVIVFKTHAAFRLLGEYPDWTIKEISRDEAICNRYSAVNIGGYLYYLEKSKGARLLQGTDGYEEIMPADTMVKVNPWIRANLNDSACRLWTLPARNIMLIGTGSGTVMPCYYEFGLTNMPALMWEFPANVTAIVEPDRDSLYIACGSSVYDFSGTSAYDPTGEDNALELVKCEFTTKRYMSFTAWLVKRMSISVAAHRRGVVTQDSLEIYISDVLYHSIKFLNDASTDVYDNEEDIFGNRTEFTASWDDFLDFFKNNLLRNKNIQVKFASTGAPFELTRFMLEMVPVGKTA